MNKLDGEVDSEMNPQLVRECRTYARYLAGVSPSQYVLQKYAAYHENHVPSANPASRFDRVLLDFSRCCPLAAALTDCYSSCFCRPSTVRRKLVLLTAILECSPPECAEFERVDTGGAAIVGARLALRLTLYGAICTLAAMMLGPLHLIMRLIDGRSQEAD